MNGSAHIPYRRRRRRSRASWAAVTLAAALVTVFAPIAQAAEQKLIASDGAAFDLFGLAVAIDGDTMVVGAPSDNIGANTDQGSASVFVRSGGVWSEQQKLTASDGAAGHSFGNAVAVAGDTIVVGAPHDDVPSPVGSSMDRGSAYVFVRSGGVWTEQAKLTAGDGADASCCDQFGNGVAISGDTIVVGAPGDNAGSASVFVRSGGVWNKQAKLTASDGPAGSQFGGRVALAVDTLVVTASSGQGSAYVFARAVGVWSEQQKLSASDGAAGDRFGWSVDVDGDTVVVGAREDEVGGNFGQGSASVFVRSGGVWTQQAKLTASDGAAHDRFGESVALGLDTIVVGAAGDDVGTNTDQGSASVFVRSGGVWSVQRKLTAGDGAAGAFFGSSAAIDGDTVAVGAVLDDVGGSVSVFTSPFIALTPPADTNVVGSAHTVTATMTELGGQPVPGAVVRFSVSGSVTASGTCSTGTTGQCDFSYTGPQLPGADSISAYADTNGNGVRDTGEPQTEATKSWVAPDSTPGSVSGGGNIEVAGNRIAFGFSARSGDNGIEGNCNVVDQAADVMVRCQDVTSFVISGNTATVFGNATVNGVATTYRIDAVDNADPGKDADTFSIRTGTGYSRSGTLTGGNVQVE